MKKAIILICIASILLSVFSFSASAAPKIEFSTDKMTLTIDGEEYQRASGRFPAVVAYDLEPQFYHAQNYEIYYYPQYPDYVEVLSNTSHDIQLYVKKERLDAVKDFSDLKTQDGAILSGWSDELEIKSEELEAWKSSSVRKSLYAYELQSYFSSLVLYSTMDNCLIVESALFLQDPDDSSFYLVDYSKYDNSYFFSGMVFDSTSEKRVELLLLEDEELSARIADFINEENEYNNDGWMDDYLGSQSYDSFKLLLIIVFCIIPLIGAAVCIIVALVKKPKGVYGVCLWLAGAFGVLTAVGVITFLNLVN